MCISVVVILELTVHTSYNVIPLMSVNVQVFKAATYTVWAHVEEVDW